MRTQGRRAAQLAKSRDDQKKEFERQRESLKKEGQSGLKKMSAYRVLIVCKYDHLL